MIRVWDLLVMALRKWPVTLMEAKPYSGRYHRSAYGTSRTCRDFRRTSYRLSVKVQERHYLWKPTVSNLGQLYPAPIEVKLVTWEQA